MTISQRKVILHLPNDSFERLQDWARQAGKTPESLTEEIVERALQQQTSPGALTKTTREILQSAGRVRSLSPTLRRRIIPGVNLEAVRASIARAGGEPLSEIILEQRGPKP